MRTSLNETRQIEDWLLKQGDPSERLVTEAKVLSSPAWKETAQWQSVSYGLVYQYGREKLRSEIRSVEAQLFEAPKHRSFQQRIKAIFTK